MTVKELAQTLDLHEDLIKQAVARLVAKGLLRGVTVEEGDLPEDLLEDWTERSEVF